jgi:type IV pilus assembly protein PilC
VFIGIVVAGAIWAFIYFKKRSRAMRIFLDRAALKMPIIGPILNKAAIARYARTLSTMFAAGVPLVEALDSVAGATGNIVYEQAVERMRDEVATGQRLQRAMENTGLFPNMVIQMIAVGEESGSLDEMSSKVATFYEAEVDNAVDAMSSLLEPLIMAILGVLVGGLVIAMYLPIFKLGAVV